MPAGPSPSQPTPASAGPAAATPPAVAPDAGSAPTATAPDPSEASDEGEKRAVPGPEAAEALFGTIEDTAPAPDEPSGDAEADLRKRNRRGSVVIISLALMLGVAYETGWLELGRRVIVGGSLPKTDVTAPPAAAEDLAAKGAWLRVLGRHLGDTGTKERTTAFLRNENADGTEVQEFGGEIAWTRTGRGDAAETNGRLTLTGSPLTIDLLIDSDTEAPNGYTRVMMIAMENTPEAILDAGRVQRVDPATGHPTDVAGISTRIGIDRILTGFRPVPEDVDPQFEKRSIMQFSVTLESGRRLLTVFRLPPPE